MRRTIKADKQRIATIVGGHSTQRREQSGLLKKQCKCEERRMTYQELLDSLTE